jgi:putative endonuclease
VGVRQLVARLAGQLARPAFSGAWLAGWLGSQGERLAARHLRKLGYRILARRYKTALGELDLVARDGDCIVFVEVKTRRSTAAGEPSAAVDRAKQARLTRLALAFLKKYGMLEQPARFDVVSIVWGDSPSQPALTHYKNAFEPPGRGQLYS